jgi:predicted Ser/Thr protein kinase
MIAPGTVLQNRYLVERQIGAGGMGAVYIATDQRFGSIVALKETFFDDPNLRKAFEREARLLNHLRHTALPRVSDHFGEEEGQFLVMEYIPGEDLSHMLKERGAPFAPSQVLAWADQLLDALDYLHTQTPPVVHRDIKPQNLKLLPRDQIVLLDFGLAKGTPLQTRVTATGSVFGYSFNYAPIEQMQGAGTDPRSDLYSLGATLYHLLTGAPPADALTRATAVLNGDPDPLRPASDLNPRVPVEVAGALSRALEQSAARRFAAAEEMRGALREAARFVGEEAEAGALAATIVNASNSEQETQLLEPDAAATSPPVMRAKDTNVTPSREEVVLTADLLLTYAQEGTFLFREAARHFIDDVGAEHARELAKAFEAGWKLLRKKGYEVDEPGNLIEIIKEGTDAESAEHIDRADVIKNENKEVIKAETQAHPQIPREDVSVVTHVRAVKASAARRNGSRRALGLAAGVIVVALITAAVYSLRNSGAQVAPAALGEPQAQATEQPALPSTQPTAEPRQATAEPSPTREATPAAAVAAEQQRPAPAPTVKNEKPREEPAPVVEVKPPTPPAPDAETESDAQAEAEADAIFRNRDWVNNPPTEEEMRRWREQHPRRARALRQRILQEQRRRGNNPRPPSPRPPGRRSPP